MSAATPLGALELIRTGPGGAATVFDAPLDDPVVAGHYPGFPVLPGVYLIETVDRTVRQWAEDRTAEDRTAVELTAMDRCRFHHPVYPGDRVFADVTIDQDADGLLCKAALGTNRGKVADIRLRYRHKENR
ncbi:3-hydroxyacyl-ACP dehydratase FabZ family protein [Streptomyces sp. NPDC102360]|uniref:3-hydroxyacyl-ACP dehydratase FabZ family protein n=1 Tax=Streptomyces sp. NPDC102360 TaxID=3366160 RepID=UPI0037F9A0CE